MIDALLFLGFTFFGIFGLFMLVGGLCDKEWKIGLLGLVLCMLSIACFSTSIYASKMLSKQSWNRPDPYVTHTIVALQDGNEINGNFRGRRYGISGYINEEFVYVYGYKTVGGGMKIQKVGEKNAVVYFSDDVTPNAKWYRETRSFWWLEEERYTCDIFIPTDSLQAELVIDLQ